MARERAEVLEARTAAFVAAASPKCRLCGTAIRWNGIAWITATGTYSNACPTTTGEITGHLPEVTA